MTKPNMQKRKPEAAPKAEERAWLDRTLNLPDDPHARIERINALIVRLVAVVGIITAIIVGVSFAISEFVVPNQTVATVNGEAITVSQFRDRVKLERALLNSRLNGVVQQYQAFGLDPNQLLQQEPYATWYNEISFPDQLGLRVINDMANDVLVRQEAAKLNISADESAVEAEVNSFFSYDPTAVAALDLEATTTPTPTVTPTPFVSPTPSPTPTITPSPTAEATAEATLASDATATATGLPTLAPTNTPNATERQAQHEEDVSEWRSSIRSSAGIGDSVIDAYFARLALEKAIGKSLTNESNKVMYVNARHILVETEEKALEIIAALKNGDSFAALAIANSTDTGSGANGGELDWAPATNYVKPFREATLTLELGAISDPIQSEFGYHIIQVRAREEREASEEELQRAQEAAFTEWRDDLRAANEGNISIGDTWTEYVPN